ncbi:MAG: DUF4982 domain-containing protein [Clostridiales bacterium]|nr:DUF4982 domain-containing protein [Clostridiales bacterium]
MTRTAFCQGWTFGKAGEAALTPVCLPHDAMQTEPRRADAPSGSGGGYYPGGSYVYEKVFTAPLDWAEREVMVEFEGVYPTAKVFLNGAELGGCAYGYNLFRVALRGLVYGGENTLRVEADNSETPNSRWYSGAGIYRPVWLLTMNREHILPDGVRVTTVSYDPAVIHVEVETSLAEAAGAEISVEISYQGNVVVYGIGSSLDISIPDAKLWDENHPNLYQCAVTLRRDGETLDAQTVTFGIRKLEWSPKGFFVNGRSVLLKGGCVHHDNGILGARSYDKSEWRRIARLKEAGFNAIRSSHNPACRAMLEACDALGVYVMDELWDMWDKSKTEFDYSGRFQAHYDDDIQAIAAKDYNHPSVVLYSIGNEVTEPAKPEGVALAGTLCDKLRQADPTRPVTAGINLTLLLLATMENNPLAGGGSGAAPSTQEMNSTAYNAMVSMMGNRMTMAAARPEADAIASPVLDLLDIAGYNYAVSRYEGEGKNHPNRIVVGSETYPYELARTWPLVEKYPYLIGDFMWTAWDYLGEAGIGGWSYDPEDIGFDKKYPWLMASAGAFDILGNDNAEAGLASIVWEAQTAPYIGVCPVNHPGVIPSQAIWRGSNAMPYWSYLGCDGNDAEVEVYTMAPEVELFVNGKSCGRETTKDALAVFHISYEAGVLRAVAYNAGGAVLAESSLRSADAQTQIKITPEEPCAKRGDILYLDIALTGENGEIECNRDTLLTVDVAGGELLAFGSANPKTEETFLTGKHTTYYGRAQAVVKCACDADMVVVTVTGEGFAATQAVVPVEQTSH